jgi:hypothetical protein
VLGTRAENRRAREHGSHRAWLAAVPIVLVNFVAFYGQFLYFQSHRHPVPGVTIPSAVSAVVATALESIAVYLAWQAHVARLKGDSALRLRLGAYLTGLGIGALNYSHFCEPGWRPDTFAIAVGVASVFSPVLWGIHSNRESRDDLKVCDQIEDHAVRLGFTRSFFYPFLSWKVRRRAAWAGENRPAEAIKLVAPPKWDMRELTRHPAGNQTQTAREHLDSRGAGQAAGPAATRRRHRQPRPQRTGSRAGLVPGRAARTAGLAVASEVRAQVVLDLLGVQSLPSVRHLARDDARLNGSVRTAAGVLQEVRAKRNGAGHDNRS